MIISRPPGGDRRRVIAVLARSIVCLLPLLTGPVLAQPFSRSQPGAGQAQAPDMPQLGTSVFSFMTDTQVADVKSGSASVDVSAPLNAAVNACAGNVPRAIVLPPGIYGVGSPVKAQTCTVHIELRPGATIRQIGPFPLADVVDTISGVVQITPAAQGSSISGGGTIDGNRGDPAILSAYLGGPRSVQENGLYVMKNLWECVAVGGVDDVRVENVTLRNCMTTGIQRSSRGDRGTFRNIRVRDSSVVLTSHENSGDTWQDIAASNIGNVVGGAAIPVFQYAANYFSQTDLSVDGYKLDGYQVLTRDGAPSAPGKRIGDPQGACIQFQRLNMGTIRGLSCRNIIADQAGDARRVPLIFGTFCDNCIGVTMSDMSFSGVYNGIVLWAPQGLSATNFVLDGQYNTPTVPGFGPSTGLAIFPSAQMSGQPGLSSAFDHNTMAPGYQVQISNGSVQRFGLGVGVNSGNVAFSNVSASANVLSGWQFWANLRGNAYPGAPMLPVRNVSLGNVTATYNGECGFQIHSGIDISFTGVVANNNRQVGGCASGIELTPGFGGTKKRIAFRGWQASDTQAEAIPDKASFIPGPTTGHRKHILMSASSHVNMGQRIRIKNAGGRGVDITGRLVDRINDTWTLDVGAPAVFSASACRTPLAGTVSLQAGKHLLSGAGTAFLAAVTGPAVLSVAGQHLQIAAARSDTQLQMDTTASPSINGAPASLVQCAVEGIPSQINGFSAGSGPDISDVQIGDPASFSATGNKDLQVRVAPSSLYDDNVAYEPIMSASGGGDVSFRASGATYRQAGKQVCIRGYAQIAFARAPSSVAFSLPEGITAFGGGTVTGFNAGSPDRLLIGIVNGGSTVTLRSTSPPIATASGEYLHWNGCLAIN